MQTLRTSWSIHNRIIWDYRNLHLLYPLKVQICNKILHAREHEDSVLEYDSTSTGYRISTWRCDLVSASLKVGISSMTCRPLKKQALRRFKASGHNEATSYPWTTESSDTPLRKPQDGIPEYVCTVRGDETLHDYRTRTVRSWQRNLCTKISQSRHCLTRLGQMTAKIPITR
jgi:hypothetical protein